MQLKTRAAEEQAALLRTQNDLRAARKRNAELEGQIAAAEAAQVLVLELQGQLQVTAVVGIPTQWWVAGAYVVGVSASAGRNGRVRSG